MAKAKRTFGPDDPNRKQPKKSPAKSKAGDITRNPKSENK